MPSKTTDVKFLAGHVRSLTPEIEKVYVSGSGDKTVFEDKLVGHKVLLTSGVAFLLPKHLEPDCKEGDAVFIEFSRSKHDGE
jgi:hypothetical protein